MGASTGLTPAWIFPITTVILAVVQEMAARLGVVTGQGLSDLIRDRFGVRWTAFAMLVLLVANVGQHDRRVRGCLGRAGHLRRAPDASPCPSWRVAIWALVLFASYRTVERVFLSITLVFIAYIVSAILAHPDWGEVGRALVTPRLDLTHGDAAAAGRGGGHHDHALHAVLPAVGRCGEGHRRGGAAATSRPTRSAGRCGPTSSRSSSWSPRAATLSSAAA